MANIITNTNVFDFMGTPADVRTSQGTAITDLITKMQDDLEKTLGRKVVSTAMSNQYFAQGLNCFINKDKLFLQNEYRDTYSISAITEAGIALAASVAYNDDNDYVLDANKGIIYRINAYWSLEAMAIKITGKYGLVNIADDSALEALKQILTELVAAKSGLWKNNVQTEDGTITTIRTKISEATADAIEKFKLQDF